MNTSHSLVITFINRREKRRLGGQDGHLATLRAKYPFFEVKCIDLAALDFASQVKLISGTDILSGVHGAGLALSMFQQPESAVVEILPHGLQHKEFRNLAKLRGLNHFGTHAFEVKSGGLSKRYGDVMVGTYRIKHQNEDWQNNDVEVTEEQFLSLMGQTIESMYHRHKLHKDLDEVPETWFCKCSYLQCSSCIAFINNTLKDTPWMALNLMAQLWRQHVIFCTSSY